MGGNWSSGGSAAPLQLLSLDKEMCQELLAGAINSRTFANATVLVDADSLVSICHFSWMYSNPTSIYRAPSKAGCSGIRVRVRVQLTYNLASV